MDLTPAPEYPHISDELARLIQPRWLEEGVRYEDHHLDALSANPEAPAAVREWAAAAVKASREIKEWEKTQPLVFTEYRQTVKLFGGLELSMKWLSSSFQGAPDDNGHSWLINLYSVYEGVIRNFDEEYVRQFAQWIYDERERDVDISKERFEICQAVRDGSWTPSARMTPEMVAMMVRDVSKSEVFFEALPIIKFAKDDKQDE